MAAPVAFYEARRVGAVRQDAFGIVPAPRPVTAVDAKACAEA